jgi:RND family efflux transporter MFP subunit
MLGMITDQRLKLETASYAAQTAAAEAEATRARAELQRINALYEKGIYAKARLEQAEAATKAADGQVAAARAQQAASIEANAQGAILAPASGRVLRAATPAGSVVSAGQTVVVVAAGEPLLRLEIPEAQAEAVTVGAHVPILSEDLPGAAPAGIISRIYPAVSAGKVVADIRVAGLDGNLMGRRVRVQIKVGERQSFIIPKRFVATRYGVDFVRLVGPGGRTSDVIVQVTPAAAPDAVEVLSGLSSGDVILAQAPAR